MGFITDRKRAAGLGSARDGVHHWWHQRVSAVALIGLAPLFAIPFAYNLGQGHERVIAAYGHPVNALIAVAFFGVAFYHLKLGLQVVIEDYISSNGLRTVLLLGSAFFCWSSALIGIFAVLRIAL